VKSLTSGAIIVKRFVTEGTDRHDMVKFRGINILKNGNLSNYSREYEIEASMSNYSREYEIEASMSNYSRQYEIEASMSNYSRQYA
jgi:hypothetical protein